MTDNLTRRQRSYAMSRIRSSANASTELALARAMRAEGITGWRRGSMLPGRPDFVFAKPRVVVFVDGCFWHGCPRCYAPPKSNRAYWRGKVAGNVARDRRRRTELRRRGWRVVRVWEHTLKRRPAAAAAAVRRALARAPAPFPALPAIGRR